MPRFSVIIPIYNKEKDVETTIKSVLNQTYVDYEVILVDDGSTDNSLNIVNAIEDDRIQIFTKQNEGVSKTRNYGITKSKAEYIAFLDADDYWYPNH
jgi:glycosyltransferase involved in cell wall biosynthesis